MINPLKKGILFRGFVSKVPVAAKYCYFVNPYENLCPYYLENVMIS